MDRHLFFCFLRRSDVFLYAWYQIFFLHFVEHLQCLRRIGRLPIGPLNIPSHNDSLGFWIILLSFTQYTQSVSLGKCSTIVSNRFTRLSFNIVRCSNSRLPSALGPTDVDSYIVCLAYVVRLFSLIKSVFPKVVNSCIPTHSCGLADLIL